MLTKSENIAVVILAAGSASRFGSCKQLATFQGEPLLLSVIRNVISLGIKPFVALGANRHAIMEQFNYQSDMIEVISILNWDKGLSETIKESISLIEVKNKNGILFLLGDQPLISHAYLQTMLQKVLSNPSRLLGTSYGKSDGIKGVPAYFPAAYYDDLKSLSGEQGGKSILMEHDAETLHCITDLLDIDEPEDLARAEQNALKHANDSH